MTKCSIKIVADFPTGTWLQGPPQNPSWTTLKSRREIFADEYVAATAAAIFSMTQQAIGNENPTFKLIIED